MKKIGIVGHGADKFTTETRARARMIIRSLITPENIVVSGHSPVGGVDIWAEEIGAEVGAALLVKAPEIQRWEGIAGKVGYRERNLEIARESDEVHVIVVAAYPPGYMGRKFSVCYHCNSDTHAKSGACWTARKAQELGKLATWHIIKEGGE